jgi:hypothetical protein
METTRRRKPAEQPDRRNHFVWNEGDLEFLGNFPIVSPASEQHDESRPANPVQKDDADQIAIDLKD